LVKQSVAKQDALSSVSVDYVFLDILPGPGTAGGLGVWVERRKAYSKLLYKVSNTTGNAF
jgi:hypothetical protein